MNLSAPIQFSLRALRSEAREKTSMHARWILPALMLLVLSFSVRGSSFSTAPGLSLLELVINTLVLFQLFSMSYYASGFTEEREAGVIDLVLLTGGGRSSIWLGILVDRLVRPVVLIAVLLPLLVLCVALGGVDNHALVRAVKHFLLAVLLCHALGALISTLVPATFTAACVSYLFWLALLFAWPLSELASHLVREWLDWTVGAQVFRSVSRGLEHVWESLFFDPLRAGGGATAASGTWKGLVCGLAWALSGVVFARWPDGVFHRAGKTRNRPRAARSRPAPARAVSWKQSRFSFPGRWFGWKYDLFWVLAAVVLLLFPFSRTDREGWAVFLAFAVCIASALRCTLEAWMLVWPELKAGTWEGLLGTPPGLAGTLREKVRSLLRHLPFELFAAAVGCLTFVGAQRSMGFNDLEILLWFAGMGFSASLLLVVATFFFSLVAPLLAPGLACGAILLVLLFCGFAQSPAPFLFLAPMVAFSFWVAARQRLSRDLPEDTLSPPDSVTSSAGQGGVGERG